MAKYRVQVDLEHKNQAEEIAELIEAEWIQFSVEVLIIPLEDEDENTPNN